MSSPATVPALSAGASSITDRRAFLATLAAAGVMTGPITDDAKHPDAELLAMEASWRAAVARRDALDIQADDALDNLVPPEIPENLCWRRSDFLSICFDRERHCARHGTSEDARHVYESPTFIQRLRERLAETLALKPELRFANADREMARMREIIEADDLYACRNKAAEDACGYTRPFEAAGRESLLIMGLLDSIIRTPARTAEGIAAKARAACSSYTADLDLDRLEAELLPEMLSAFKGGIAWDERRRLLSVSLIVDAMKFGSAVPAASSAEVAA